MRALLLLAWATYLSTAQLARAAGYPTLRRAQRRLRVPLDHGLTRAVLQSGALHLPSLHLLTPAGCDYLVEHGLADERPRPGRPPRHQKRAHGLLIRDVFVEFVCAELRGTLALDDFRFDGDLARGRLRERHGLIPDGLATVLMPAGRRQSFGIECDTGSETTTTLSRKFNRWRDALDDWEGERCTVLVVALGERRLRTILRLLSEARLGDSATALLPSAVAQFIQAVTPPYDPAARPGRSERRTAILQLPRLRVVSRAATAAYRGLR